MDALGIHTRILEALLGQGCNIGGDYGLVLNVEFFKRVIRDETGSLHSDFIKGIRIYQNHSISLAPFHIGLESCRVHSYKEIAIISRGVDVRASDVDLKSRHARNSAVRGTDFCRIVRESGKLVSVNGRHIRKE